MDNIQQFIDSGVLEVFLSGSASETEEREVLLMKQRYPEVQQTLNRMERDIEALAQRMAVPPPHDLWNRIEADLCGLIPAPEPVPARKRARRRYRQTENRPNPDYIEVQIQDSHLRIHKNWKWVFAAVFVLGKIFLACAIYFYLENRQAQQNIQELKQEVKDLRSVHR